MPYIEVEAGVRLYYQAAGSGPPVVFVPSGAMTHAMWDHEVAAIGERFHTVVYDYRGTGRSDVPPHGPDFATWARDLCTLIEHLRLERPALVTHGLGGHVALLAAAARPELVGRLALVSAAPWSVGDRDVDGGFSEGFHRGFVSAMAENQAQANWDLIERRLFHADPGEPTKRWLHTLTMSWPLAVFNAVVRDDLPGVDHRERLAAIRCPVLVMHGRHDIKNRYEGAGYLAEHLPEGRLVTFENSAHMPQIEEAAGFRQALLSFLAGEHPEPS